MINSTAMFYTMLAFLPLLDAGNKDPSSPTIKTGVKSQFIATSSIGAFSRRPGAGFAYAGSKAAVIHMVKQLSTNLVPYQIRANVIAPGIYPSVMSDVSLSFKFGTHPFDNRERSLPLEGKMLLKKARCLRVWFLLPERDLRR
jgi:NAD(P)-dependent dehydrogenase (short-subunit alcohol dehydrogenase family)